ncbi:MAG: malonyl-CoA synthase [Thiohalomonadales bacterium]|nr:malonyl-CoA synthase [Thiohalomonadales bacterium]
MNTNIYNVFSEYFPADMSATFIETGEGEHWQYTDLEQESARLARFLTEAGIQKGERVAVQVDKTPQALFLYLACLRAGFIYLPLNTAYTESELAYFIDNAEPAAVVCRPDSLTSFQQIAAGKGVRHFYTLEDAPEHNLLQLSAATAAEFDTASCSKDDVAVILYTSGTTGRPKGAMITHGNLAANGLALKQIWGFTRDDVLLHALPIFHIHGLFVACHCVLLSGSKMLFLPKFSADTIIKLLPRATVLMGVPTFYTRLLDNPAFTAEVCSNMRLFISGSAPLLEQTFAEFQQRTGHTILERYGMTETGMNTSNPLEGERKAGTVGFPLPGVTARIVDDADQIVEPGTVGNLQVKGGNVFLGYWRMPDKTAEEFTADGYFKTGDMASLDDEGYIFIVGRGKDMVITGGFNVYPKEIELLIDELEGVVESAVIGVPHPDFGEAVTAVVTRDVTNKACTEANIIAALKPKLANFKIPKRVMFVDDLPRNTMGKVQKNLLRESYADLFNK